MTFLLLYRWIYKIKNINMKHLESYELKNQKIDEGFGTDETAVIKELKADLEGLVKQNVAVTDFSTTKFEQREKRLDEILHDLSFIVARYADITDSGDFVAKPLNEIQ
jgi:hypothetical protein